MALGGALLRVGSILLRGLEFCASAVVLGIFSYFLAVLADNSQPIARWKQAVEGMSGAAVLYTIFGVLFTICLGGNAFFGTVAIVLDICFVGCFVAIAILTRHGANSCSGFVRTPLGDGDSNTGAVGYGVDNNTYSPNLHTACRLNTAVFAVSIIAIFLFLLTALYQIVLIRHHRKEKAAGVTHTKAPKTGRSRGAFWKRNKRSTRDTESATYIPPHSHHDHHTVRPSGETGTTIGNGAYTSEPKYGQPGYGQTAYDQPTHGHNDGLVHDRVTRY